jgi:hypothetical protein
VSFLVTALSACNRGRLDPVLDYGAIAAFLDSGVSMVGASANDDLEPEAFRMWGASLGDGGVLRALVSSDAGETFQHVSEGTVLCMTFADPLNLRSVQVKGRSLGAAEPPGPGDLASMEGYEDALRPKSRLNGTPPALLEAIRPRSVFVVSIVVEEAYDQTPGPSAGTRLEDRL